MAGGGVSHEQTSSRIILTGGGRQGKAGEGRGRHMTGRFPQLQHPGTPDQSGISPDRPGAPLPEWKGSWECPISHIQPLGGVKPLPRPSGDGNLVLNFGTRLFYSRSRETLKEFY